MIFLKGAKQKFWVRKYNNQNENFTRGFNSRFEHAEESENLKKNQLRLSSLWSRKKKE